MGPCAENRWASFQVQGGSLPEDIHHGHCSKWWPQRPHRVWSAHDPFVGFKIYWSERRKTSFTNNLELLHSIWISPFTNTYFILQLSSAMSSMSVQSDPGPLNKIPDCKRVRQVSFNLSKMSIESGRPEEKKTRICAPIQEESSSGSTVTATGSDFSFAGYVSEGEEADVESEESW